MFSKFNVFVLLLICRTFASNEDYVAPTTLMNVSVFIEKGTPNDTLHVFFMKTHFSLTERSLQYYLIDDIIFTHTQFVQPTKTGPVSTIGELKTLLEQITADSDKMKQVRELSKTEIAPFIYQFESLDGSKSTALIHDQQKFEFGIMKFVFKKYDDSDCSFILFGNHFDHSSTLMKSLPTNDNVNDNEWLKVFVRRNGVNITTPEGKTINRRIPLTLSFIERNENARTVTQDKFHAFDVRDYGKGWKNIRLTLNAENVLKFNETDLKDDDPDLKIISYLDQIFSKEGEANESAVKPITNFVQHKFFFDLSNLIEIDKDQKTLLFDIMKVNKPENSAVFEKLDETKLEEDMRGKYKIVGALKKSFEDDVFRTNTNPFVPIDPQLTTTSSSVSSSSSSTSSSSTISSAAKKDGMSGLMIALIIVIVVVVLAVIGGVGWYYMAKARASENNAKLRNRNL